MRNWATLLLIVAIGSCAPHFSFGMECYWCEAKKTNEGATQDVKESLSCSVVDFTDQVKGDPITTWKLPGVRYHKRTAYSEGVKVTREGRDNDKVTIEDLSGKVGPEVFTPVDGYQEVQINPDEIDPANPPDPKNPIVENTQNLTFCTVYRFIAVKTFQGQTPPPIIDDPSKSKPEEIPSCKNFKKNPKADIECGSDARACVKVVGKFLEVEDSLLKENTVERRGCFTDSTYPDAVEDSCVKVDENGDKFEICVCDEEFRCNRATPTTPIVRLILMGLATLVFF